MFCRERTTYSVIYGVHIIYRVGQIRMSGFQTPYMRILYVRPLYPRSVACSFADLEGFIIPSSFPHPPPPLHALQLAYQPLHPICSFFDNHWLQPTPKRLWLRIAQKNTARIRRIYGNTEFGYGGGRLENTAYIPEPYSTYNYMNTDLANPKYNTCAVLDNPIYLSVTFQGG